eukprot:639041-Karenia_brevis.AAC.1
MGRRAGDDEDRKPALAALAAALASPTSSLETQRFAEKHGPDAAWKMFATNGTSWNGCKVALDTTRL